MRCLPPRPAAITVIAPTAWVAPSANSVGDVPNVAASAGQFSTLTAAINAAGMYDSFAASGPITVFAPTDQAFANLPAGTLDKLLKVENREALRKILSYHIISGLVPASSLMGKTMSTPTQEGMSVWVDGRNGVKINTATVLQPDIKASNGIIHSVDTVLMPTDLPYIR